MPADFRRVEEIYFAVSAMPVGERAAGLRALCGSDVEVRREVESLLSHQEGATEFLAEPALGGGLATRALDELAPRVDKDDLVGQRVGKYKVEARIASGGMGTVYLAVRADEEFEQQVALKVVKRGMDTEEILARFKAERQTLAQLGHENIARVIDGGMTGDGRPYLAMEYVKGEAIDDYCARKQLGVDARLRLFRAVCEAVRYAHQNLVVHRDLKPGNILVTDEGVPKLLDFGIAKVLTRTRGPEVTTATERRLTPEYASPEQISGAMVTTSSDVYSLGVILYELLAGRRPFDFGDADGAQIERQVLGGEVVKPSVLVLQAPRSGTATPSALQEASRERLSRQLRGDLDTIVLAAMHRDAARRYSSVEALIADIDRYFRGLPISAQKDTLGYRVRKFVRRNAVGVAFAATAGAIFTAGVVGVVWQGTIAARERDEADHARVQVETAFEEVTSDMESASAAGIGLDGTLQELMRITESRVLNEQSDEPLVQAVRLSALGRNYMSFGVWDKASEFLTKALEIRRSRLPSTHHDIAESTFDMGELAFARRELEEAESHFKGALAIYRAQRSPISLDTAKTLNNLASTYRAMRRLDEAESLHNEALAMRERLRGRQSMVVAESLNNLANVQRQQGKLADAILTMREALDIRRSLRGEDAPLVLQSMQNLAVLLDEADRYDEARQLFEQVLLREGAKLGVDNPAHGTTLRNFGMMLLRHGENGRAEEELRKADEIHSAKLREDDARRILTEAYLGRAYVANKKWVEGEEVLGRVLPRMPKGTKREQEDEGAAREAYEIAKTRGRKEAGGRSSKRDE